MRRLAIPAVLAVLALSLLVWRTAPEQRPEMVDLREDATYGELALQSADGPLKLSDLRGKIVVVYFGYTSCPDICPTTLYTMGRAFRELTEEEQAELALLFVSVDPERDELQRLADYARYFHPSFRGASATPEAVRAMATDWGVAYRKADAPGSAMGYTVDHSTQSYLVGRDGELLGEIAHGTSPEVVAERLRSAL